MQSVPKSDIGQFSWVCMQSVPKSDIGQLALLGLYAVSQKVWLVLASACHQKQSLADQSQSLT